MVRKNLPIQMEKDREEEKIVICMKFSKSERMQIRYFVWDYPRRRNYITNDIRWSMLPVSIWIYYEKFWIEKTLFYLLMRIILSNLMR